jgi:DNA (cytosine-5)-methyltransferase 1
MKYLSVCSGIEAATMAWHDLGWKPAGFSEIEPFPSAVLAHHYPNVTNFGDMTKYKEWNIDGTIDLLVGGTPCQSFSVAGLRKGMDDPRGNLALVYCGMLDYFRPNWFVWENVPGVLSSSGGRDFGSFLGAVAQLGYGFSYRVLDAQFFGVAQRRRRVFVVGHIGDWRPAAAVLFERHSLRRDLTPSAPPRKEPSAYFESSLAQYREGDIGGTLKASGGVLGGGSETFLTQKVYETHPADSRVREMGETCQTVTSRWGTGGGNVPLVQAFDSYNLSLSDINQTIKSPVGGTLESIGGVIQPIAFTSEQTPKTSLNLAHTLTNTTYKHNQCVAYSIREDATANTFSATELNVTPALQALRPSVQSHHAQTFIADPIMKVRRLTPIECERLQGFPDSFTDIPWRKKELSPDGLRYKALGNSMAVPVMQWIGDGIEAVRQL